MLSSNINPTLIKQRWGCALGRNHGRRHSAGIILRGNIPVCGVTLAR